MMVFCSSCHDASDSGLTVRDDGGDDDEDDDGDDDDDDGDEEDDVFWSVVGGARYLPFCLVCLRACPLN